MAVAILFCAILTSANSERGCCVLASMYDVCIPSQEDAPHPSLPLGVTCAPVFFLPVGNKYHLKSGGGEGGWNSFFDKLM